jgi:hypothetical protein
MKKPESFEAEIFNGEVIEVYSRVAMDKWLKEKLENIDKVIGEEVCGSLLLYLDLVKQKEIGIKSEYWQGVYDTITIGIKAIRQHFEEARETNGDVNV